MEKEMRELYTEGVATRGDPESCAVAREDGGEALIGARAGGAIEPRNPLIRGADAVDRSGRPYHRPRYRELSVDPARSKNPGMHGISMRENRELPDPPAWVITGRAAQGTPRRYA